jgi:hypothetical protein
MGLPDRCFANGTSTQGYALVPIRLEARDLRKAVRTALLSPIPTSVSPICAYVRGSAGRSITARSCTRKPVASEHTAASLFARATSRTIRPHSRDRRPYERHAQALWTLPTRTAKASVAHDVAKSSRFGIALPSQAAGMVSPCGPWQVIPERGTLKI